MGNPAHQSTNHGTADKFIGSRVNVDLKLSENMDKRASHQLGNMLVETKNIPLGDMLDDAHSPNTKEEVRVTIQV